MQRGFTPIMLLVGILVLALVGGGAYYFGTLKNTPQTQDYVLISQTPKPTQTPDETANWKTYTDEQSGYSMKYPVDWVIDPNCSANSVSVSNVCFSSPDLERDARPIVRKGGLITVSRYKFVQSTLRDFNIDDFCKLDISTNCKQIKLDQMEAWQREVNDAALSTEVIVLKDKKMFLGIISGYTSTSEKSIQKVHDQILSTFKFIQ